MDNYWDESIYAEVEREALRDYHSERPPRIRAEDVLDGDELDAYYQHEPPARAFRRRRLDDPWRGVA
jgi:hypothetical protein